MTNSFNLYKTFIIFYANPTIHKLLVTKIGVKRSQKRDDYFRILFMIMYYILFFCK